MKYFFNPRPFAVLLSLVSVFALNSISYADTAASVSCATLVQSMLDYQKARNTLDTAVVSNMNDAAQVIQAWYSHYSVSEGSTVFIPGGTFRAMQESADTERDTATKFSQQQSDLSAQYLNILVTLPTCLK